MVLKVPVIHRDAAVHEELQHAGLRQRVEIPAEDDRDPGHPGDGRLVADAPLALHLHHDGVQLVHQHDGLDELDVAVLRVPVDVGRGHQHVLGRGLHAARARGLLELEQGSDANVVPEHDPVQHGLGALGVGHGQLVELDEVLLD